MNKQYFKYLLTTVLIAALAVLYVGCSSEKETAAKTDETQNQPTENGHYLTDEQAMELMRNAGTDIEIIDGFSSESKDGFYKCTGKAAVEKHKYVTRETTVTFTAVYSTLENAWTPHIQTETDEEWHCEGSYHTVLENNSFGNDYDIYFNLYEMDTYTTHDSIIGLDGERVWIANDGSQNTSEISDVELSFTYAGKKMSFGGESYYTGYKLGFDARGPVINVAITEDEIIAYFQYTNVYSFCEEVKTQEVQEDPTVTRFCLNFLQVCANGNIESILSYVPTGFIEYLIEQGVYTSVDEVKNELSEYISSCNFKEIVEIEPTITYLADEECDYETPFGNYTEYYSVKFDYGTRYVTFFVDRIDGRLYMLEFPNHAG